MFLCICESELCVQGIDMTFVERLHEWCFHKTQVSVAAASGLPDSDEPTALLNALRALTDLQASGAVLHLEGWDGTVGVATALAAGLRALTQLAMGIVALYGLMTDSILGALLQIGRPMHGLCLVGLQLVSHEHAQAQWPWNELWLEVCADVAQLLSLPSPRGLAKRPVVHCVGAVTVNITQVRVRDTFHAYWHACMHAALCNTCM